MATWFRPTLSADEQTAVLADRDEHPHPVVGRTMLVLWAVHLGHPRQQAADLAHVGVATAKRYVLAYRDGGLDGLRRCDRHTPTSELADHADAIRQSRTEQPVRTTAEAADRIATLTGMRRGLTQTRTFLAGLGFTWQRTRAIPVPPKSR
jgi:transposase